MMALVRVYTKRIGAKPDFDQPVVLTKDRGGTTVESLCAQVRGLELRGVCGHHTWREGKEILGEGINEECT